MELSGSGSDAHSGSQSQRSSPDSLSPQMLGEDFEQLSQVNAYVCVHV